MCSHCFLFFYRNTVHTRLEKNNMYTIQLGLPLVFHFKSNTFVCSVPIIRIKENNMNTMHTTHKQSIPMGIKWYLLKELWRFIDHNVSKLNPLGIKREPKHFSYQMMLIIRLKRNDMNSLHTISKQSIKRYMEFFIGYHDFNLNLKV